MDNAWRKTFVLVFYHTASTGSPTWSRVFQSEEELIKERDFQIEGLTKMYGEPIDKSDTYTVFADPESEDEAYVLGMTYGWKTGSNSAA